jgi:hypothetical protein
MPNLLCFLKRLDSIENMDLTVKSKIIQWPEASTNLIHSFNIKDLDSIQRDLTSMGMDTMEVGD